MSGPPPASGETQHTPRHTVMVVDDEPEICKLVQFVLKQAGYEVLSAGDASRASALLETMASPPDLLLTDVVMPGMSGPVLAEKMIARFGYGRVLFMSAYDDRLVVKRYVLEKGFALISKPFQLEDLCRKVKSSIDAEAATATIH